LGAQCAPKGWGSVGPPSSPPRVGNPCSPHGTSTRHPLCQRPAGRRAMLRCRGGCAGARPQSSPWLQAPGGSGLALLPGTACSASLTPSGIPRLPLPGPGGPQRRVGWGAVVAGPGPSPAAVPLPESRPLCLADHQEAPVRRLRRGLTGGGDAESVPGTQVPQGSRRPHPPPWAQGAG